MMSEVKYTYQSDFFDFVDRSSSRSAAAFLPKLDSIVNVESVLDVGCGRGVWLAAWKRLGKRDVVGVDGDYVDTNKLHVDKAEFQPRDISLPFDLGRKFGLVECLEVAEHVPESRAETLIDNLTRHGELVLFSAATPGQGGEHHINEQPLAYWLAKFRRRGYAAFDVIRPLVRDISQIEPWYRFNALMFASAAGKVRLRTAATPVDEGSAASLSAAVPFWWRVRCAAIRNLPAPIVDALAKAKHRVAS
jgi:SAM-dependent methyltransferase